MRKCFQTLVECLAETSLIVWLFSDVVAKEKSTRVWMSSVLMEQRCTLPFLASSPDPSESFIMETPLMMESKLGEQVKSFFSFIFHFVLSSCKIWSLTGSQLFKRTVCLHPSSIRLHSEISAPLFKCNLRHPVSSTVRQDLNSITHYLIFSLQVLRLGSKLQGKK